MLELFDKKDNVIVKFDYHIDYTEALKSGNYTDDFNAFSGCGTKKRQKNGSSKIVG